MFVHVRSCLVTLAICVGALAASTGLHAQSTANPIKKQIFAFPDTGVVSPVPGLARDNAGALYGAAVWGGPQNSGGVYKLTPPAAGETAWTETILHTFSGGPSASQPQAPIIDSSGALYGALYFGGPSQKGQIYKLVPPAAPGGAWTFSAIYTFTGAADGEAPQGRLRFDASGALYGVTAHGGANRAGVVYRLVSTDAAHANWTYEKLWDLETPDGSGGSARASEPVFDSVGALYTATAATRTGAGGVIKLVRPAAGETAWRRQFIYRFTGGADGAQPGPIAIAAYGVIFGMTTGGGAAGAGQVYRIVPPPPGQSAWTKTALHDFPGGAEGGYPAGGLLIDTGGALYGATSRTATNAPGVVFKLAPPAPGASAWTKTILASFYRGDADGLDSLTFDASGYLNMAATNGGAAGRGAIYTILLPPYGITNQNKTSLYSFPGGLAGEVPDQSPIFGPDGALYGTTQQGGGGGGDRTECGMAYKLAPPAPGQTAWTKTDIAYFSPRPWPCIPWGPMTFGDKGVLYGFSWMGGPFYSEGTLFRLTPTANTWDIATLFKFPGGAGGGGPAGQPIIDGTGAVYGVTNSGGTYDKGLAFKLTPGASWTQTVLHHFGAPGDGQYPHGGLISDTYGVLYGTTDSGGVANKGTIFKLAPPSTSGGAWTYEILFSFSGVDGSEPESRLTIDADGSLFGTTSVGGAYNRGTIFRLAAPAPGQARWTHAVLYNFRGNLDGLRPESPVIIGRNRFLYGTTVGGGASNCGMAYRLIPPDATHPQWRRLILHSFACAPDGKFPRGGLVSSTHGELYGVTGSGGNSGKGQIFRLE